jgi:putative membrane protein
MIGFIIRILGNSLALYMAYYFVPGFIVSGSWKEYLLAGAFLGLLNLIVRPILKLISMPLIILTLGLFTLVINGLLLWTVDYMFDFVSIRDVTTLLYAVVVVTVVNLLISTTTKTI